MAKDVKFTPQAINSALLPMLDVNNIVFWLSSDDFAVKHYINNSFESLWQQPSRQLLAGDEPWIKIVHEKSRAHVEVALQDRMRDDNLHQTAYQIARPDDQCVFITTYD